MKRQFDLCNVLYDALSLITMAVIIGCAATVAKAQACVPPLYQGNVNSCQGVNIKFLNKNAIADIDRFIVRWNTDGVTQELSGSALGASRTGLSCNWSSSVTITQYLKSGASCVTNSTGSAPHTFPCSLCANGGAGVSVVSAANFRGSLTRGALVAIFPDPGVAFTDSSQHASSVNLPTSLAGVSVEVAGQLCGMLDATPGQLNVLLPDNLPEGPTEISLIVNTTRGTIGRFSGRVQLNPNAPGVFTAASTGDGLAAAVWLVARANGTQQYYSLGQLPALAPTDIAVIVLYGTGFNVSKAALYLGNGRNYPSVHVVPSGFAGVQQLAFQVPSGEVWRITLGAFVRAFPATGGYVDSQGFDVR